MGLSAIMMQCSTTQQLGRIRRWAQRKRTVQACLRCKLKKMKCGSARPCDRCMGAGHDCCEDSGRPIIKPAMPGPRMFRQGAFQGLQCNLLVHLSAYISINAHCLEFAAGSDWAENANWAPATLESSNQLVDILSQVRIYNGICFVCFWNPHS